jgi:hypothetical protein
VLDKNYFWKAEMQIKLRQVAAVVLAMLLHEVSGSENANENLLEVSENENANENLLEVSESRNELLKRRTEEVVKYRDEVFRPEYYIMQRIVFYKISNLGTGIEKYLTEFQKNRSRELVIHFLVLTPGERKKQPLREPVFIDDHRSEEVKKSDEKIKEILKNHSDCITSYLKGMVRLYSEVVTDAAARLLVGIPDKLEIILTDMKDSIPKLVAETVRRRVGRECIESAGMLWDVFISSFEKYAKIKLTPERLRKRVSKILEEQE